MYVFVCSSAESLICSNNRAAVDCNVGEEEEEDEEEKEAATDVLNAIMLIAHNAMGTMRLMNRAMRSSPIPLFLTCVQQMKMIICCSTRLNQTKRKRKL